MATEAYGAAEMRKWSFEYWNELWGCELPEPCMALYNASTFAVGRVRCA
jgi:hypothetical protein